MNTFGRTEFLLLIIFPDIQCLIIVILINQELHVYINVKRELGFYS